MLLRCDKRPLAEIAQRLGFKTHSAVLKRIRKIGKAYERFMGGGPRFQRPEDRGK